MRIGHCVWLIGNSAKKSWLFCVIYDILSVTIAAIDIDLELSLSRGNIESRFEKKKKKYI